MKTLELFELPHVEARALLATGVPVYLTVNPVEYHGPHLSLHNDRLVSRGLSRDVAEALAVHGWPCVFAADLELGDEPCPGIGTRRVDFQTVRAVVVEACRALAELGAQRVAIMTFHGAPLHGLAIEAGVQLLRSRGVAAIAPFHGVLRELIDLVDPWKYRDALATIGDERVRAEVAAELRTDFHAGFFETSMAMHYAPQSVSKVHRELPPCPVPTPDPAFAVAARAARLLGRTELARELDFAALGTGWNKMKPFRGYTGRPALASPEAGAAFAAHILAGYVPAFEDVLLRGGTPPAPVLAWAETVSLGGRLAPKAA